MGLVPGTNPGTNKQIPDHSIMDRYNKQVYLGNQFGYSIKALSIASVAEVPLLLISNPAVSASAFPSGWQALFINLKTLTVQTVTQDAVIRCYANPTVTTGGTAEVAINRRPLSPTTSIAVLGQQPTIAANGTLMESMASIAFESIQSHEMQVIDPGQAMLITVQASANPTLIGFDLGWYQL